MTLIIEVEMEKERAMELFLKEGGTIWIYEQKAVIKSVKRKEEKE